MSSGLRLRRPVFFAAGLRCPVCLRRIALCPVFLSVFRLSLAGPHFPLPAFPFARVSLCPCLPSFVGSSSVDCIPSGFSSVISCFSVHRPSLAVCCPSPVAPSIVHRPPLVVRRPLRRPSSIARRLLSVAHCLSLAAHCLSLAAHCLSLAARCPSLAACCPSLVAPFIVHRPSFVVRRPLSIPCCPLPVTCRPLFIARRLLAVARTPYPVPRTPPRLFPLPFGPDHGFCIRGIPACVSAGAACRVVPQRVPSVGLSAKMRPPSVPWSPRRF